MSPTNSPESPIRIHGFPLSGHSHRVKLFASLAGIPHEDVLVDLAKGEHKTDAFLRLNPAGQVPVIEDGALSVADSNAILVYLAQRYAPEFYPSEVVSDIQRFLTLASGELAFGPAAARLINVFGAELNREFCEQVSERLFTKLETHLQGRQFLVSERPTIADVALYSYTAHAPEGGVSLAPYANVRRWLNNIEHLDGFVSMPATKVGLAA